DRAAVGQLQPRDDPQERRLARARRPQQRQQRAARHLQADMVQRPEPAEAFAHVLDGDAHACLPLPSTRSTRTGSRRACRSSATFTISVTRASRVSTEATANEPGVLYSWNSFSTRSGMVSVWPATFPETT